MFEAGARRGDNSQRMKFSAAVRISPRLKVVSTQKSVALSQRLIARGVFWSTIRDSRITGRKLTRQVVSKEVGQKESSADELQPEIAEVAEALKRELLNNIARTLLFAGTSPRRAEATKPQPYPVERKLFDVNQSINLYEELRQYEINLIRWALRQSRGRQKTAARLLGIKPTTLNNKIKQYNIAWKDKAVSSQS